MSRNLNAITEPTIVLWADERTGNDALEDLLETEARKVGLYIYENEDGDLVAAPIGDGGDNDPSRQAMERRKWQDAARERGETPECGREVCTNPADPAQVNTGTPLLYCTGFAKLINKYNPGLCTLEKR